MKKYERREYAEINLPQVTAAEFNALVAASLETSVDTCRYNESGTLAILKYDLVDGAPPEPFITYAAAINKRCNRSDVAQQITAGAAKKFRHDKKVHEIVLKFKGGK